MFLPADVASAVVADPADAETPAGLGTPVEPVAVVVAEFRLAVVAADRHVDDHHRQAAETCIEPSTEPPPNLAGAAAAVAEDLLELPGDRVAAGTVVGRYSVAAEVEDAEKTEEEAAAVVGEEAVVAVGVESAVVVGVEFLPDCKSSAVAAAVVVGEFVVAAFLSVVRQHWPEYLRFARIPPQSDADDRRAVAGSPRRF